MTAGLAVLLGLGCILLAASTVSSQRCGTFTWQDELGENPMSTRQGKVVLVALMKGYCSYCVNQAARLEALKSRLASEGYPDIAMVIVNGGEALSRNNIANLQTASSIPVIQDNEQHVMYRDIFRRNKDDFIVFDRCGQRAVIIPHPYSYLGSTVTERVLKTVYNGRHSCYCHLDSGTEDGEQMPNDEPQGPSYSVSGGAPTTATNMDLHCPRNDDVCRSFQRNHNSNRFWNRRRRRGRGRDRHHVDRVHVSRAEAAV